MLSKFSNFLIPKNDTSHRDSNINQYKPNHAIKNIFAFWESENGMPAYLELCKRTWKKHIPDCNIHIINYENLHEYIDGIYDLEALKKIPLAMQSDIISAAILEKFGGLFLDLDCIVTDDIFQIFNMISKDKLIAFGNPITKSIHLAVLYSFKPGNPILKQWRIESQLKLENSLDVYNWDYFGNSIVNPLLRNDLYKDNFHIIERSVSGNILESTVLSGSKADTVVQDYQNFYFNKYFSLKVEVLELVKCGVISLHNSWTPSNYKNIKNIDNFIKQRIPLNDILNFTMVAKKEFINHNVLPILDTFLYDRLNKENIIYKQKYFKGMLVIDFKVNNIKFAFDISEHNNFIDISLILRDDIDLLKNNIVENYEGTSFISNKLKIISTNNRDKIIDIILSVYKIISNYQDINFNKNINFNSTLVKKNIFIDLKDIKIENKLLFIEGVCIPIGINVSNYEDIEYVLIFEGEKLIRKSLAKSSKPELSDSYSTNYNISYDKCWFTTYGYKGIDISNIEEGNYQLKLEIKVKDHVETQPLRSESSIAKSDKYFDFISDSAKNNLTIF